MRALVYRVCQGKEGRESASSTGTASRSGSVGHSLTQTFLLFETFINKWCEQWLWWYRRRWDVLSESCSANSSRNAITDCQFQKYLNFVSLCLRPIVVRIENFHNWNEFAEYIGSQCVFVYNGIVINRHLWGLFDEKSETWLWSQMLTPYRD